MHVVPLAKPLAIKPLTKSRTNPLSEAPGSTGVVLCGRRDGHKLLVYEALSLRPHSLRPHTQGLCSVGVVMALSS
jgi:hypothetical protein